MDTVINSVHIHVKKTEGHRLVFANGGMQAYPMYWNKKAYRWEFISHDLPEMLTSNEMEISNAIIMEERTKKS